MTGSPGAISFLRSMGTSIYDEAEDRSKEGKDALGTRMGEN